VAVNARDLGQRVWQWLTTRRPRAYLFTGWILFVLGSYPGYMSTDSILQLYTVRSGDFSDYSPMMTAVWSTLEWVIAGPFPMLALQSGLFIFGAWAILATRLTPRVAAVTASLVLLFPPVFSTMAVIWPEPLMAGALLAATGAALQGTKRWTAAAACFALLACACHPAAFIAVFAVLLALLPPQAWWRRAVVGLGAAIAIMLLALGANELATVVETHTHEQNLQMLDIVGTLRRAKVKDEAALRRAVEGMSVASDADLVPRMGASASATSPYSLWHGDTRVFDPIATDEQADATHAAWRRVIREHPGAYLSHRWAIWRAMLKGRAQVFDNFGSPDLLAPLHHRAIPSDWEKGVQKIVHGFAKTPLFWPWIYLVLGALAIFFARKLPLFRNIAIAGIAYQLAVLFTAPSTEYRYAHWLVVAVTLAVAGLAISRRTAWRREE
jgi:hypothetical protein